MKSAPPCVLTINAGSSSIRFAVYAVAASLRPVLLGKIDRIGLKGTQLLVERSAEKLPPRRSLAAADHRTAAGLLLDWLEARPCFSRLRAVGHRVVHGMKHAAPERVTPGAAAELRRTIPYDPDHLPREIELIEAIRRRHPQLPQVACFDTAFHRTMPRVAQASADSAPLRRDRACERYGFHGLSYAYLMEELAPAGDPAAARGRVILAHLGNGASLAAVRAAGASTRAWASRRRPAWS